MKLFFNNQYSKIYEKQEKMAIEGLLAETPNFIISLISAIFSKTIFVWADVFLSMIAMSHFGIVSYTANRMKNENGDRYNYGVERLEVFVSFIINVLICFCYLIFIVIAFIGIIHPKRPADALGYFIILKIVNISYDAYFYLKQHKIYLQHGSSINETELASWKHALILDVTIGLVAFICFYMRDISWSWYISPLATIILSIIFGLRSLTHIRKAIMDLSDESIELSKQDEIYDILLEHAGIYKTIYGVNCHVLNNKLYIELDLEFYDDTNYKSIKEFLAQVEENVVKLYPGASLQISINTNKKEISIK